MFFNNPSIQEIKLKKDYKFMYDNFIITSQQTLILCLESNEDLIDALKFSFSIYKYGYPNDEVSHPLQKFGLGFYGFYKVSNSPWLTEIVKTNRLHPSHKDDFYSGLTHYIAKFKDVTFEVISREFEEIQLTKSQVLEFISQEIKFIQN